ncbi:MAG: D-amino acid aminotransferase [Gammaproteobacteria bacterium]|nr:D-amino acid aminotransferase [Gammaproteobacteria bacterium]
MSTAYLNGTFLPLDQAQVSVMDRGFLFGDGIYEVIPVYNGKLFRLAQHLRRLQNSLDGVRIGNPLTDAEWTEVLTGLVARNAGSEQAVYLQVTRGVAAKRDHAFPVDIRPTVFAMSTPASAALDIASETGIKAVTLPDIRWQQCNIKAITLLPNVLLRQQAIDAETAEAILIRNGYATEGAASNIFIVHNGVLVTPPKGPSLLPGITRDLVLELAAANGIPFREAGITERTLEQAEEIWITSSTREISPVTHLNDSSVANGQPGPLWQRMIRLYQDYKEALRTGKAS